MERFVNMLRNRREAKSSPARRGGGGFTLIELLIVIAIILILIAIALPNFLEAQIRAKVAKAKGEIRSFGIGLEAYYLDFKTYPAESEADPKGRNRNEMGLFWLTTPIKYMGTVPQDPFAEQSTEGGLHYYETGGIEGSLGRKCLNCLETWAIFTRGPDLQENELSSRAPHFEFYGDSADSYSPTNGTKSFGDIFQFGGDSFWIGVNMSRALRAQYTPARNSPLVVDHEPYLHRMPPKLR